MPTKDTGSSLAAPTPTPGLSNRTLSQLFGGTDPSQEMCLTVLGRYPGIAGRLDQDQFMALATGTSSRLVVPLRQLLHPGIGALDRASLLASQLPPLADEAGPTSAAADLVTEIASLETSRVFAADKLDLPATLVIEHDDLRLVVAGQDIGLHAGGLQLPALNQISVATVEVIAAEQVTAARQLVDLRLVQVKTDAVEQRAAPEFVAAITDPGDYALQDVVQLSHACRSVTSFASSLAADLHPANADLRAALDAQLARLQTVQEQGRRAVVAAYAFAEDHQLDSTAGEVYDQAEDEYADSAGVSPEGALAAGNWLATTAFHTLGELVTFGGMGRSATNAAAYRQGLISWNAYRENEAWSFGVTALAALAAALTGGLAGRAVGGLLGAGMAVEGASVLTGTAVGGVSSAAGAAASDAGALVASAVSSDRYVAQYQRSSVVGPLGWLEAGMAGSMLGGLLGKLFGGRGPGPRRGGPSGEPATAADDLAAVDNAATVPTMVADSSSGPVALVEGRPVKPTSYGRMFHGNDLTPEQVRAAGGFKAAGQNWDLVRHTEEGWRLENAPNDSAFRGGTPLAGNAAKWGDWVYELEGVPSWDTNQVMQGRVRIEGTAQYRQGALMHGEVEHSLPGEIPLEAIKRFGRSVEWGKGVGVREWFTWETYPK